MIYNIILTLIFVANDNTCFNDILVVTCACKPKPGTVVMQCNSDDSWRCFTWCRWDEHAWSLYLKSITCLEILWRECLIYIKTPMQSNPTHPLGRNQSPSPEKKLGVQRRPQRTSYPQEESLQHLAVDHITGVNASRGPI